MIILTPRNKNFNHWLFGVRWWQEHRVGKRFIWEFVGKDASGQHLIFKMRGEQTTIAMTVAQLEFNQAFRPFLINNERLDDHEMIVSAPKVHNAAESKSPNPPKRSA